ncbi:MAG: peptide chain release factor 1 [Myxococcota bacterium]|jgi:peptide chain release factor 1|nr:peptide chain release factor 1 [Myxococcota bacterium]
MFEKLAEVEKRFEDLSVRLADPEVLGQRATYLRLAKEHEELRGVVEAYQELRKLLQEKSETKEMMHASEGEMRELAREELALLEAREEELSMQLKQMLLPKDPLDEKNIILEVRAGTGGDEAALFAGDLFNMYARFASRQGWKLELLSASEGTAGGYKEVIALISGEAVYSSLKFEAGTHRVQRVPVTESQGRIHTSACTVAILPEAEEIDVRIEDKDLQIDTYRASGAGGQHVNKTDSAVRITHLPTGLVVTSQDERSQHKNRSRAMTVLRSRLLELENSRQDNARASDRRNMVGSGDRSERIRTYNFPQNRITDHRIGLTLYSLDRTMATGELDELISSLRTNEQQERMRNAGLLEG